MRSVQAFSRPGDHQILSISFKDISGDIVARLGEGSFLGGQEHYLKPSEELIGVYGVKDQDSCFTSFGFIAMTRNFK